MLVSHQIDGVCCEIGEPAVSSGPNIRKSDAREHLKLFTNKFDANGHKFSSAESLARVGTVLCFIIVYVYMQQGLCFSHVMTH